MNPYSDLPEKAFWRSVRSASYATPKNLYEKRWDIAKTDSIATAGSCFAQHIGRNLFSRGFNVLDMEPAPNYLTEQEKIQFGYSIYSARYGNIYTVRQLFQLAKEAYGDSAPNEFIWEKQGRYFDALRPGVEPFGLSSVDEVKFHRSIHLKKVRAMFDSMRILVFTLGLTESWVSTSDGYVFPTAPGVIAGEFDSTKYKFVNFNYNDIVSDFLDFMNYINNKQGRVCKFILTVSPVPLNATASIKNHVMQATFYSKSVLRAAAGFLSDNFSDIDYFPSFEIITNPWVVNNYYEENMRDIRAYGVQEVMKIFFTEHDSLDQEIPSPSNSPNYLSHNVACEELLLNAFGATK